jgi:hypothetical protein
MNKKYFLFLLSILIFKIANAGHFVGNGGLGYKVASRVYLLDFLESSLENSAQTPEENSALYINEINKIFPAKIYPNKLIAGKLAQIASKDPSFSNKLLATMKKYIWNQSSLPLMRTGDESVSTNIDKDKLVQLALRRGETIYIDSNWWRKLDVKNQVGLVFHETIYGSLDMGYFTNGFRAREIVSFLFNSNFNNKNGSELDAFLGHDIENSRFNLVNTALYGGYGTAINKIYSQCPFGFTMNGIRLTAGNGMTSIGVICKSVRNNSTWVGANIGTDAGPGVFDAKCNDDEYVSGAVITAGPWQFKKNQYFTARDIQLYCSNILTGKVRNLGGLTNQIYSVSQSIVCPENLPAAVGIVATLSDYLVDIGFSCYFKK